MIGIYGANGFIGRHILQRVVDKGHSIRAISRHIDNDLERLFSGRVEFREAVLQDAFAMDASLQGVKTVVQLVSTSTPGFGNRYNVEDICDNVIPHVRFMQAAVNAKVEKYIFISSGGTVYGPGYDVPIQEDAPTNPISSHGLIKITIEKYLQMHGYVNNLNYIIMRLANPYGPGQTFNKGQGLIPSILGSYIQGTPVKIIGDGSMKRDYIFISDVIDAIEIAINREDIRQSVFNIGSGKGRSVIEVVEAIENKLKVRLLREYIERRKTDVDINVLSIDRAQSLLNWVPKIEFDNGLQKTLGDNEMLTAQYNI